MKKKIGQIGYFHGRFQPFHNGHLEVVKYALDNCDTLVIGISNPFRLPPQIDEMFSNVEKASMYKPRLPENNPWPYWARLLMIKNALHAEGLLCERVIYIPNLLNTGLPIDEIRFPKEFTTVFLRPKDEHNKATLRKYINENWKVIEMPISEHSTLISATDIRYNLRNGLEWKHLVPEAVANVIIELNNSNKENKFQINLE
ncbi:MAG: adenylyltransferase/cytidyltransferase family protein [Saprospiraceae bacterium]